MFLRVFVAKKGAIEENPGLQTYVMQILPGGWPCWRREIARFIAIQLCVVSQFENNCPSGAEAPVYLLAYTARLKSRPFTVSSS
jgi:hypothetical protein